MAQITTKRNRPGFYVCFERRGRRTRVKAGDTRKVAERKALAVEALVDTGYTLEDAIATVFRNKERPVELITFAEASERSLEESVGRLRASTVDRRRTRLNKINRTVAWAKRRLVDITGPMLNAWVQAQYAAGLSPCTVHRDLAAVSSVCRWGLQNGILERNPATGGTVSKRPEPQRERWWDKAEQKRLIAAAPNGPSRDLVAFILAVGPRRKEAAGIEVRDVDRKAKSVRVRAEVAKDKRERVVPLTPEAWEIVTRQHVASGPLFRTVTGRPWSDSAYNYLIRSMRKKVPDLLPKNHGLHAGRHTYITLAVASGESAENVGKLVGQSSAATTARYSHPVDKALREVADRIGKALHQA